MALKNFRVQKLQIAADFARLAKNLRQQLGIKTPTGEDFPLSGQAAKIAITLPTSEKTFGPDVLAPTTPSDHIACMA